MDVRVIAYNKNPDNSIKLPKPTHCILMSIEAQQQKGAPPGAVVLLGYGVQRSHRQLLGVDEPSHMQPLWSSSLTLTPPQCTWHCP